jgi:FemAB-related protein (PEP-CTERM system-associated)
MEVLELREHQREEWDSYVHDAPQATIFHLSGWKDVMEHTFGLGTRYLYARDGNQILGVLPLLYVKNKITGHYFTSMPGAICTQDDRSAKALVERAKELVRGSTARYLTLRDSLQKWEFSELVTNEDHCTMMVKLFDDPEQIWRGVNRRVRQSTKKAISAGVEVVNDPGQMESFYPVYSKAMRDMGTPTLGIDFFRNMLRQFPEHFTVMTVRHDRQVLGGGFVALFQGTVYQTWGGMLRESYELRPNYILYWETLKYACENGFQWADLGRSQWNSGTFNFKKHWQAEPRPLYQQFYLNGTDQPPPVGSTREDDVQYRIFVSMWRHLPLPMTELLGPQLRSWLPFG